MERLCSTDWILIARMLYVCVWLTSAVLGWMEGGDQSCIECEMESVAWVKVVGLAVGLVVTCLLLVASYLCYQKMAARGVKKDAGYLRSPPRAQSSLCTAPAQHRARVVQHNSTQAL
jgi:hypothetical protein